MRNLILVSFICLLVSFSFWFAEASVKKKTSHSEAKDHEEHGEEAHGKDNHGGEGHDEEGHEEKDHGGDHDHKDEDHGEEEGNSNVGSDKGILEASEDNGIKLSPEALKNFEIKKIKLSGDGPWSLPLSARLLAGEEVNLYRVRAGYFKRIDFKMVTKNASEFSFKSEDLIQGDEIVVSGVGFLRIAEIAAFGGAPEGHSH